MSGRLPIHLWTPWSIPRDVERIKARLEHPAPGWTALRCDSTRCNVKIAKHRGAFAPQQLAMGFL